MSKPRPSRPDLATAPGRPAPRALRTGDVVRHRTQKSLPAYAEGTATLLGIRHGGRLGVVSVHHEDPHNQATEWRTWNVADIVLVRPVDSSGVTP